MNIFAFVLATLLIGLATGALVGAGLAFTHGRTRADLVAGLLGSIVGAVPLHVLGPAGYREPLPALLVGVSAAILATWLQRIVTWEKKPLQPYAQESAEINGEQHGHSMMTTAEGTRFLLGGGRLRIDEPHGANSPLPESAAAMAMPARNALGNP